LKETEMDRRDALKVIGCIPLAGFIPVSEVVVHPPMLNDDKTYVKTYILESLKIRLKNSTTIYVVIGDTYATCNKKLKDINRAWHVYDSESFFESWHCPAKAVHKPWNIWTCDTKPVPGEVPEYVAKDIELHIAKYKQFHAFQMQLFPTKEKK
jgi:hypothetical protein